MPNFDNEVGPFVRESPQAANQVFCAPAAGKGFGLFRALIATDIPNLNFSKISGGIVPIAQGGTGVTLAATGGASQVLKQVSSGANITVAQLAFTDISGTASGAQLPNPSSSTLGGVESLAAVSHKWINTISTSGVPAATQPATTDLSDWGSSVNWTPTDVSGASLTFTVNAATYLTFGPFVFLTMDITFPVTANTSSARISLPTAALSGNNQGLSVTQNSGATGFYPEIPGTNQIALIQYNGGTATLTNAQMSAVRFAVSGMYRSV
jgi:hypothetical protein